MKDKIKVIIEPLAYRGDSAWVKNLQKRKIVKDYGNFLATFKHRIIIAHYNWINYINPFQALRFLLKLIIYKTRRIKVVWTVHNVLPHTIRNYPLAVLQRRFLARIANHLTFFSKNDMLIFEKIMNVKIAKKSTIVNCGPTPFKIPYITRKEARTKLKLNQNKKYIIAFGGIQDYKGVDILIQIFKEIEKKIPNVELILTGKCKDAELKMKIEELLSDVEHYRWLKAFLTEEDLSTYIIAADLNAMLFRVISNSETFLLSKRFPTKIVVPYLGSLPAHDKFGQPAFFYNPNDREDAKNTIIEALNSENNEWKFISDEECKEEWDKIYQKIYAIYRGLTKKPLNVNR